MKMATKFGKIQNMKPSHANDQKHAMNNPTKGKSAQAEQAFIALLNECSRSGYFGSVSLTLNVQDGHIQHVRIATDRQLK